MEHPLPAGRGFKYQQEELKDDGGAAGYSGRRRWSGAHFIFKDGEFLKVKVS